MTEETKYLARKEVVVRLAELISATDYARTARPCLSAIPLATGYSRSADDFEVRGVVRAIKKLGVTLEEVNQKVTLPSGRLLFNIVESSYGDFPSISYGGRFLPDTLCEIVAGIMDKKDLLKKVQ